MDQPLPLRITIRYGLRTGIILGIAACADVPLQAWRRALGPEWHFLALVTYLLLATGLLLCALAGFWAGRASGHAGSGTWAGALTGGLAGAAFGVAASVELAIGQSKPLDGPTLGTDASVILIFAATCATLGGVLGAFGGVIGRARYRKQHGVLTVKRMSFGQNVRAVALGLGLLAATFLLAVVSYVASDWAAAQAPGYVLPLAVAAIIVAVGLFVGLRSARRLLIGRDWLALACLLFAARIVWPEGAGLSSSVTASLFFYLAYSHLVHGAVADLVAALPQPEERGSIFFRDNGERIVIYPDRPKLGLQVAYCAVLAAATFGSPWVFSLPSEVAVPLGLLGGMAILGLVPVLIRLLHRWPSLIVTSDGITDQASAYLTGFWLIPWSEIDGVYVRRGNWRHGRYAELVLMTANDEALLARHSPLKRFVLRVISQQMIGDVHISTSLLSPSPADAAARITAYVKTHAPPGYLGPVDDAETPSSDIRSDEDVENNGEVIH